MRSTISSRRPGSSGTSSRSAGRPGQVVKLPAPDKFGKTNRDQPPRQRRGARRSAPTPDKRPFRRESSFGSTYASSTASYLTGEIQATEPLEEETANSTPSSVRPDTNRVLTTPVDHSGDHSSDESGSVHESLEDIPTDEELADPLYRARVSRGGFNGVIDRIERGAVTKERLYRVWYDDGDIEHITAQAATLAQMCAGFSTAKGRKGTDSTST